MPRSRSPPLPESASEWIHSENIAELPVMTAATDFVTAMAMSPRIAATMDVLDWDATLFDYRNWSPSLTRHDRTNKCGFSAAAYTHGLIRTMAMNPTFRLPFRGRPLAPPSGKYLSLPSR